MEKKVAIFAFNGEPMCFVHALLNALDMQAKGYDVKLIIEGSATRLVKHFMDDTVPFADLYARVKAAGLIDCVCRACAAKMESLKEAEAQQLPLCREMSGHPSMAAYFEQGYHIITL
jgi:predicted peroxiredoxin